MKVFLVLLVTAGCLFSVPSAGADSTANLNKPDLPPMPNPVHDGREGGETLLDAFPINTLPFEDSGATCDNLDDYEAVCPNSGFSPDVVYRWVSTFNGSIFVDLCGSRYDSKVYVLDTEMNVLACNDDYYMYPSPCGNYVSYIGDCPVTEGEIYFIVVDGYGTSCGEYFLSVDEVGPCVLACSAEWQPENEPPLVDEYIDLWNGGCDSEIPAFQTINNDSFCGVAGWFVQGSWHGQDSDWLEVTATGSEIQWEVTAQSSTTCRVVMMDDCGSYDVPLWMNTHPCQAMTMTIPTQPGETVYLSLKSQNLSNPGDVPENEYQYICHFTGIETVVPVDKKKWDGMRALYR